MTALQIVQKFYPEVKTVVDGNSSIIVEVTKRDCESKAVKSHKDCALALACKRHFDIQGVIIAVRVAYLVEKDRAIRYGLGEAIAREITAFDRHGSFAPGEYKLLQPSHKIGDPKSSGSRTKSINKGKTKIVHRHLTSDIRRIGDNN